jgi:Fe-S-cluster containining protein
MTRPAADGPAFASWLADTQAAIRGERDAVVPCGDCTACCTSSQFVHIGPEETDALAHLPADVLFPVPGFPPGHVLMGYDDRGHCPMFVDGGCSVYEHRPRTCRTYDCRVFTAAGIAPDAPAIAARVEQWQFSYPTRADTEAQEEVRRRAALTPTTAGATRRAVEAVTAS